MDKDGVCPSLYKKPDVDPYGVHLNETGKKEVAKAITEGIKEIAKGKVNRLSAEVRPMVEDQKARERSAEIVCTEEMSSSPLSIRNV